MLLFTCVGLVNSIWPCSIFGPWQAKSGCCVIVLLVIHFGSHPVYIIVSDSLSLPPFSLSLPSGLCVLNIQPTFFHPQHSFLRVSCATTVSTLNLAILADMPVSHLTLTVTHLPTSTSFFLSCLQPLGYQFIGRHDDYIGFGQKQGEPADFWVTERKPGYVIY